MAANIKELKENLAYSCNILANEATGITFSAMCRSECRANKILMNPIALASRNPPAAYHRRRHRTGKKTDGKYERHSEVSYSHRNHESAQGCQLRGHSIRPTRRHSALVVKNSGRSATKVIFSTKGCRPSTTHCVNLDPGIGR